MISHSIIPKQLTPVQIQNNIHKMMRAGNSDRFISELVRKYRDILPLQSNGTRYPKYIYHFTSENNAKKIFEDGVMSVKSEYEDIHYGPGIFSLDLQNFLKRWDILSILTHSAKETNRVTALRIPTKLLDKKELRIRRNDLFSTAFDYQILARKKMDELIKQYNVSNMQELLELIKINEKVRNNVIEQMMPYIETSVQCAGQTPLLKAKKQAIEFMYPKAIDAKNISQLGVASIGSKSVKEILMDIFKNEPEINAINILI